MSENEGNNRAVIIKKPLGFRYDVFISNGITDPEDYLELLDTLRSAGPNDAVCIFLNSEGGNVDTGIQILSAMKDCAGTVVTVLDGYVRSMAALLFLAGRHRIVKDNSIMMLHEYSTYFGGKASENKAYNSAMDKAYGAIVAEYCSGFLSDEEISRMFRGEDLYFLAEEVRTRISTQEESEAKEDEEEVAEEVPGEMDTGWLYDPVLDTTRFPHTYVHPVTAVEDALGC